MRPALPAALKLYQATSSAAVQERQDEALASQRWSEHAPDYLGEDVVIFGYPPRNRRDLDASRSRPQWLPHRATQYRAGRYARWWVSRTKRAIHG